MIIDSHAHIFPDEVAPKAVAAVLATGAGYNRMRAHTDGTRAGLIAAMRRAGIDRAVNLPVATEPGQVAAINAWAAKTNVAPVYSLAAIHPDTPDPRAVLGAAAAAGLKGIKMHPEYQAFDPLEARLEPIWQACEELEMPIFFHSGYDAAFPPPLRSSPAKFAILARRHPGLRLVLAHCGCLDHWREIPEIIGPLPAIAVDLSYSFGIVPPDGMLNLIRALGAQRVLFGTDSPWRDATADLAAFRQLPLAPAETERILWQNVSELLGLDQP